MTKIEGLIQRFQNPIVSIPYKFDATREIQISKNEEILKWVIKAIISCRKQYTALHGHLEDICSDNCDNFLANLKLLSETKSNLKHHLDAPSAKTLPAYLLVFKFSLRKIQSFSPSFLVRKFSVSVQILQVFGRVTRKSSELLVYGKILHLTNWVKNIAFLFLCYIYSVYHYVCFNSKNINVSARNYCKNSRKKSRSILCC